ncbi:MAG: UPF0182 family protein [Chloroflexi bacterium]|nr:UPF0182 family protein [Chloroflexota bacterium]
MPPEAGAVLKWGAVALGLIVLFVLLNVARGIYTDWLWFDSLGFVRVYTTMLVTRVWLFFAGALVMAALLGVNLYLAYRYSQGPMQVALPPQLLELSRRFIVVAMAGGAFLVSIIFGSVLSGRWETFLRFFNAASFGRADPLFHRDAGFYVFSLPLYHTVQGWLLGAVIVLLLATVVVYFSYFSLRGLTLSMTPTLRTHLAVLGAAFMVIIALGHLLDMYELLFSTHGAVTGATYTDVSARLAALRLLTGVALVAGVGMLVAAFMRNVQGAVRMLVAAFGLWAITAFVAGVLWPSAVQRFVVTPNEFEREQPYITENIAWTRFGFALEGVQDRPYPVRLELATDDILNNPETIDNIRLWDHRPLRDVYNQIQHLRLYYQFLDVDVDRYTVDGRYRQAMLAARELSPENLPTEAQRWVNRKLQFTHGYGVVMSPVTEFTTEGRPEFFLKDVPPQGDFPVTRPEIYYGEGTKGFVIVNSGMEEFDRPATEDGLEPSYSRYQGKGDVQLGSFLRRLAYAWQFGDINVLISGQVTPTSRVQYRRQIQERVRTVAPFLLLDQDPYLVLADGKLFWIQDAYTATDRLPYAKRFATADGSKQFNYIRNSVKVVVDAYDGSVQLFTADLKDPMLQTYLAIFPTLFQPMEEMSPSLQAHVRYPEDLFTIQSQLFLQYHMTDPKVFFNKEDQWSIPTEAAFQQRSQPVEPYYLIMKLPGEEKAEFVLILPFTPANKPNLVSWLAARNDPPHYGELVAFNFPKDRQVFGPAQAEARIDNDPVISAQFTLWGQVGSIVIRGNLLVIPVGGTIIYAEPVYLQPTGLQFPELKRVILLSGDRVVMTPTLQEGVAALLGEGAPAVVRPPTGLPPGGQPGETTPEQLRRTLEQARSSFETLRQELARLEQILKTLEELSKGSSQP